MKKKCILKRTAILLLSVVLILSFTACGDKASSKEINEAVAEIVSEVISQAKESGTGVEKTGENTPGSENNKIAKKTEKTSEDETAAEGKVKTDSKSEDEKAEKTSKTETAAEDTAKTESKSEDEIFEEKLNEYAKLVVDVGLNLKEGASLVYRTYIEHADFAQKVAAYAYEKGAKEVYVRYTDPKLARINYLYKDDSLLDTAEPGKKEFYDYAYESGMYCLADNAPFGINTEGIDLDRMLRMQKANAKARKKYVTATSNNDLPWTIISIPDENWAKKVFPDLPVDEAVEKLWDKVFEALNITGDQTASLKWQKFFDGLSEKADMMNDYSFESLHYTNSLGTDLTVELPENAIWVSGRMEASNGTVFAANLPSLEIYTSPKKYGANGTVYASKPLVINGTVIEDFYFVIKDGKIVDCHAEKGQDALEAALNTDEGARYLGEIALVPYDSAISKQNILYYNTLYDENAACHIAFGQAFNFCIKDGKNMNAAQKEEAGINSSGTHIDFMMGTSDLQITGKTKDGKEIAIFKDGNFAF